MRNQFHTLLYSGSVKNALFKSRCNGCILMRQKYSKHAWTKNVQTEKPIENVWSRSKFVKYVPEYDWDYITDPRNTAEIHVNIQNRKGVGDIHKVLKLYKSCSELKSTSASGEDYCDDNIEIDSPDDFIQSQEDYVIRIEKELYKAVADLPNKTHPQVPIGDESCSRLITTVGTRRVFDFPVRSIVKMGTIMDGLRTENLGVSTGHKTYYFKGAFARLQNALVRYAVDMLRAKGFELVTVPELVHPDVIAGCGFNVEGERTQVYHLDMGGRGEVCLAGTGEIPLAGRFAEQTLTEEQLPKRICTVSRCYRAEASSSEQERGIYRVHQFTKVEMFGVTRASDADTDILLEEFLQIQKELYSGLGLHFRILEMSSHELGSPAYRKFDMEAWMPHNQFWGEISSTSDCRDYQSRRLGIKYWSGDTQVHAHTVNGTACAIPRLIMALAENFQTKHAHIEIPEVLQPYLGGATTLTPPEKKFKTFYMKPSREYRKYIEEN